jgi:hypothetical protein
MKGNLMKKIRYIILPLTLLIFSWSSALSQNASVQDIINETNLDSLLYTVRILSGEDSAVVGNSTVLITNRTAGTAQNELAADYIKQRLIAYNLSTSDQYFGSSGRNVLAVQPGIIFDSGIYILCAHYDGVTSYCADDNASGTAAVLEAARILSQYNLGYTLIYALWDEEEQGLIGSHFYATQAAASHQQILGVLNLDMLGWDGNNDGLMDIHTRNVAQSIILADLADSLNTVYSLGLNPVIYNPGTTASDHASFWNQGYSAILCSEAYYGSDFNPYYHSSNDRLFRFNQTYFHSMARLTSAIISTLVDVIVIPLVYVEKDEFLPQSFILAQNYPNPFNSSTTIEYTLPTAREIDLSLYNMLGEKVSTLSHGFEEAGTHSVNLNSDDFSSGIYLYVLRDGANIRLSRKMIILK